MEIKLKFNCIINIVYILKITIMNNFTINYRLTFLGSHLCESNYISFFKLILKSWKNILYFIIMRNLDSKDTEKLINRIVNIKISVSFYLEEGPVPMIGQNLQNSNNRLPVLLYLANTNFVLGPNYLTPTPVSLYKYFTKFPKHSLIHSDVLKFDKEYFVIGEITFKF
jgi:hypothetical protein